MLNSKQSKLSTFSSQHITKSYYSKILSRTLAPSIPDNLPCYIQVMQAREEDKITPSIVMININLTHIWLFLHPLPTTDLLHNGIIHEHHTHTHTLSVSRQNTPKSNMTYETATYTLILQLQTVPETG